MRARQAHPAPGFRLRSVHVYMDVDVSHGLAYGETLTCNEALKPAVDVHLVHAQVDLDLPRFTRMFVELMSAPTPQRDLAAKRLGAGNSDTFTGEPQ
jgi:hypothetical protein